MKLVTFGIDNQQNLIVQFPVFFQPYTQKRLIMYQIETVPVPILDENEQAHSYTELKIEKPYIALTLSTPHTTIVVISCLVKKVPLQELLHATEYSVRLV